MKEKQLNTKIIMKLKLSKFSYFFANREFRKYFFGISLYINKKIFCFQIIGLIKIRIQNIVL